MKVAIEHGTFWLDAKFVVADLQGWRSSLGHNVDGPLLPSGILCTALRLCFPSVGERSADLLFLSQRLGLVGLYPGTGLRLTSFPLASSSDCGVEVLYIHELGAGCLHLMVWLSVRPNLGQLKRYLIQRVQTVLALQVLLCRGPLVQVEKCPVRISLP